MIQRYALPLRILHWLMAVLLIGMLCLGLFMTSMSLSPTKLQVYSWHKWIGMSLFFWCCYALLYAWQQTHLHNPITCHLYHVFWQKVGICFFMLSCWLHPSRVG